MPQNTNLHTIIPSPVQKLLLSCVKRDMVDKSWALVKAGQRSGKSSFAIMLAKELNSPEVFLFSGSDVEPQAEVFRLFGIKTVCCRRIPRALVENKDPRTLVVLDEAMWLDESYYLFTELRSYGASVLAISSRGPEYDTDMRWRMVPGYSFNTWDMNPHITFDQLKEHHDFNDPKTVRDFCAF